MQYFSFPYIAIRGTMQFVCIILGFYFLAILEYSYAVLFRNMLGILMQLLMLISVNQIEACEFIFSPQASLFF